MFKPCAVACRVHSCTLREPPHIVVSMKHVHIQHPLIPSKSLSPHHFLEPNRTLEEQPSELKTVYLEASRLEHWRASFMKALKVASRPTCLFFFFC